MQVLRFSSHEKKGNFTPSIFPPSRLIAIFHPKWPSAFPPPRSISVSLYWILTKSRGWGTFGSPIRMSLRTSIGMRWSPNGWDFIKPLPLSNEFSSTRRYTILLAAIHRRRRSCAPPSSRRDITGRTEITFRPAARRCSYYFNGECCYSGTNDPKRFVVIRVSTTLNNPYFLFFLSSFLFQRRSNGHRAATLRREANTDCVPRSFGSQVSQSARWHAIGF